VRWRHHDCAHTGRHLGQDAVVVDGQRQDPQPGGGGHRPIGRQAGVLDGNGGDTGTTEHGAE
jgi:hypothetical protein